MLQSYMLGIIVTTIIGAIIMDGTAAAAASGATVMQHYHVYIHHGLPLWMLLLTLLPQLLLLIAMWGKHSHVKALERVVASVGTPTIREKSFRSPREAPKLHAE